MLTQFETDARRHEINYELQCRQHEAMKQYVEEKNKIERERDGVKADYQAARELLEKSLDNLLKERIELKRRGLECFAPEMEDNYCKERELHRDLQEAKNTFNNNLYAIYARKEAEHMAYEELCMLNKKWYAEQVKALVTEAAAA